MARDLLPALLFYGTCFGLTREHLSFGRASWWTSSTSCYLTKPQSAARNRVRAGDACWQGVHAGLIHLAFRTPQKFTAVMLAKHIKPACFGEILYPPNPADQLRRRRKRHNQEALAGSWICQKRLNRIECHPYVSFV